MINKKSTLCFAFDKPMISNSLSKKRVKMDRKTCANLILGKELSEEATEALAETGLNKSIEAINDNMYIWEKKNWSISLDYHLWSRKDHLFDKGNNYKKLQEELVNQYIMKDGLPNDKKVAGINSMVLSKDNIDLPIRSLSSVLVAREAVLATPRRTVPQSIFSSILWHGLEQVRRNRGNNIEAQPLTAVDSFGVAFDVYLTVYSVDGLESGIYFYDLEQHKIDLIQSIAEDDLRSKMYDVQVEQKAPRTASFNIMLVANFDRYQWRYRHEAALKHLYINCGQILHDPMLVATCFEYKTHISPAIMDTIILDLLKLNGVSHQAMYILSIG